MVTIFLKKLVSFGASYVQHKRGMNLERNKDTNKVQFDYKVCYKYGKYLNKYFFKQHFTNIKNEFI